MIKFVHKKRVEKNIEKGKLIVYYNFFDILLGVILFSLVVFFINYYLSHSLKRTKDNCPSFYKSLNADYVNRQ